MRALLTGALIASLVVAERAYAMPAGAAIAAVARYNDPVTAPPRSPLAARVEALVQQLATAAGHRAPTVDARLEAAAALLAPRCLDGQPPPDGLTAAALWHVGVVEPLPYLLVLSESDGVDDDVIEQFRKTVPPLVSDGKYRRVAAWVAEPDARHRLILLVLQESALELDAVPRQLRAGGALTIAGRVLPPFAEAELFATAPDGKVAQAAVTENGGRFAGPFRCASDGRWQLEIVASGPFGSTVLANFPVYCGVTAPASLPDSPLLTRVETWSGADDAERRVLAALNHDRSAAGLPALALDAALSRVARAHARDMLEHAFVGHTSPSTGSPSDRVRRAGIPTPPLLLENVAVGSAPEQVERSFVDSPAHRANLLNARVDHVGIGAAVSGQGNARELYVTQLFARVPAPTDGNTATAHLRERAASARRAAHVSALATDPDLERIALSVARGLADGSLTREAASAAVQTAGSSLGAHFSSLRTVIASTSEVDELRLPPTVADGTLTHAGISAAVATRGDATVHCVILLGVGRKK